MSVTLPVAAICVVLTVLVAPVETVPPDRIQSLAVRGPLRVLPELDIDPDVYADERLTAAPVSVMSTDFVAVELNVVAEPVREEADTETPPAVPRRDELEALTMDDIQDAVRTTGLPMPAASELEVLHIERPVYPRRAIELGVEGRLEIALLVDEHGRVIYARAIDPDRLPLLEGAATEAAYRYLFRPYLVRGAPTSFWVRIPFEFRLLS
jgi:TonB family protein